MWSAQVFQATSPSVTKNAIKNKSEIDKKEIKNVSELINFVKRYCKQDKCANTNEIVTTGSTENCESEKMNTEVENDKKVSFDNVTNVG